VYRDPDGAGYLLDTLAEAPKPAATLNPVLEVEGVSVSMVTRFMVAVPAALLKTELAHLQSHRTKITAAVDLLFQGF